MAGATMEEGILLNVEGALQPCDICGRTFLPEPLTKHMRVCERNATRKRKVFDSLKQRVEGTELAQFVKPANLTKPNQVQSATTEANRQSKWKEKHLELQNTIKAARDFASGVMPTSPRCTPLTAAGSERCPSCDRQFGIKAFDRHVEWCKERKARIQKSPVEVSLAKERLEARTKYRVPPPKAKRALIRDKYSPTLVNKTEVASNLKSVSCTNLEKGPNTKKPLKGHLNSRTERDLIKLELHNEPVPEIHTRHEEGTPKLQTKQKCVPKDRKTPGIEGLKGAQLPRLLSREKVNATDINTSIGGITVSHMTTGDMKEPGRMISWIDIHDASTSSNATSNSDSHNRSNSKKNFRYKSITEKIVDTEIKPTRFPNIENLNESDKLNKTKLRRKCSKIDLAMDSDCCSVESSKSLKLINYDDNLKRTPQKIIYKSLNDLQGTTLQHNDRLHLPNINKKNAPKAKSKAQTNNQLDLEEDECEATMTSKKLRVPFSIAKYHKSKLVTDEKIKTAETKLQLPHLDRKCHTITEYDEDGLIGEFGSEPAICENQLTQTHKTATTSDVILPHHLECSSFDSLDIDDAPQIDTVSECSVALNQVEQYNIDCFEDSDNMSDPVKMYDSQGLKDSDILCAVQDICKKEKHCLNARNLTSLTGPCKDGSRLYVESELEGHQSHRENRTGRDEQIVIKEESVYLSNNVDSNAYETSHTSRQQSNDTNIQKDRYKTSTFRNDCESRRSIELKDGDLEGSDSGHSGIKGMKIYLPNNSLTKFKISSREQTPDESVEEEGYKLTTFAENYAKTTEIGLESSTNGDDEKIVKGISCLSKKNKTKSKGLRRRQTPCASETSSRIDLTDDDREANIKGNSEKNVKGVSYLSIYTKSKGSNNLQTPCARVEKSRFSTFSKDYENRRKLELETEDSEANSKGDSAQIVSGTSYNLHSKGEIEYNELVSREQIVDANVQTYGYNTRRFSKEYENGNLEDSDQDENSKGDGKQSISRKLNYSPYNTETKSDDLERANTPDTNISTIRKNNEHSTKTILGKSCNNDDIAILGGYGSPFSSNTSNNIEKHIPFDEMVIPTIAKSAAYRLQLETQNANNTPTCSNNDDSVTKNRKILNPNKQESYKTDTHEKLVISSESELEETSETNLIRNTFTEYHCANKGHVSESQNSFDFDSLENVTKRRNSSEKKESAILSPKCIMELNSIDNKSDADLSVLHPHSREVAAMDSFECIDVNAWNEELSIARMQRSLRRCSSSVCLSTQESQDHNFATFTDLELAKYTCDDYSSQGRYFNFQYKPDGGIVEGNHIELQYDQRGDGCSELSLSKDYHSVASFRADGDCLTSARSSSSYLEYIPTKRRKLCDDIGDATCTSSTSECSSIGNTANKILYEHNLTKNLETIKSRKQKLEHEVDRGEIIIYDKFESSQTENFKTCATNFQHSLVNCTNNCDSDSICSKTYPKELEQVFTKTIYEEHSENCPVGDQLMKNEPYNLEIQDSRSSLIIATGSIFEKISPRFLHLLTTIINDDGCRSDNSRDDMFVVSKDHCKKLIELDPHMLNFPPIAETQLQKIKNKPTVRKISNKDSERPKLTLPPISAKCNSASKISTTKLLIDQRRSRSSLGSKEPLKLPEIDSSSRDTQSDYNPFVTAERQLMELLECDDFKPFFRNKSPSTQQLQRPSTTSNTHSKLTDIHKNNKVVKSAENARKNNIKLTPNNKRASVIDPPMDFQDNMNLLSDDFELIERLINQNYADGYDVNTDFSDFNFDSISNKIAKNYFLNSETNENNHRGFTAKERKYSDDMSSIDPRLINENDNLSIPEHFKIDDNSSNSSNDNLLPLQKETYVSKRVTPKITTTEKINRSLNRQNSIAIRKPKQINDDKKSIKPIKQATKGSYKSTTSLTSSYGSTRINNINTDKKKNVSTTLKRSVSLIDPVKPKNMKNKQDVENYFDEQDRKKGIKTERISPDPQTPKKERSPEQRMLKNHKNEDNSSISNTKSEELFSVDDEMYEEYKKYEEMYLLEKQHMQSEKKPDEPVSLGTLTPNEGSENVPTSVKASVDSAYSSLNRNTPKIRARSTKLAPLDFQASNSSPESPHSSGSEDNSPTFKRSLGSPRMSKFCHDCGSKYPINTAKFCVECGVRRLVL